MKKNHALVSEVISWFAKNGRDLPWRKTQNAYHICVSEIMLQQTQVRRVIPFYQRWLEVFPDWQSLAIAPTSELIQLWSGLGYNRRALGLREIAGQVCLAGEPTTSEGWLALKGIGPYTAAAIVLFAGQGRTIPIDTNVRRVLGRFLLGEAFPESGLDVAIRASMEEQLKPSTDWWSFFQGLFDLASEVCLKKPDCGKCPLKLSCPAHLFWSDNPDFFASPARKVSRESRFRNKPFPNRIYRGRILKAVKEAGDQGLPIRGLGKRIDAAFEVRLDQAWLESLVNKLAIEGFLVRSDRRLLLA